MNRFLILTLAIGICWLFLIPPANSQNISYLGSTLWSGVCDVKIQGNYAYCAFFNGLVILDITNPSNPTFVSKLYIGGDWDDYQRRQGQNLFILGDYVYFTADTLGLKIIDVSDPASPMLVAEYPTFRDACGIYVLDNYAYLTSNRFGYASALEILDIGDPSNPMLVGSCDITSDARGIWVEGNYAYVADDLSGLQIIDISDRTNPRIVGHYQSSNFALDVTVSGNYAYIAYGYSGLVIVDVSDPTNPVYVGGWSSSAVWVDGVAVNGNYAYLPSNGGFTIVDISNPANPAFVWGSGDDWFLGVDFSGNYVYAAGLDTGLRIVDVTNPRSPFIAGTFATPRDIRDAAVVGNYAYVVGHDPNLSVIDISNPAQPTVLGSCITRDSNSLRIKILGNYAYMINDDLRFYIIDIHDPNSPLLVGTYRQPDGGLMDLFIVYPYAYLAASYRGLYIVDISDPANPTYVGNYDTPGSATGVYVRDNYAYVADLYYLLILDISIPGSPVLIGTYTITSGASGRVTVQGNYAYLSGGGGGGNGMLIVNVSDSAFPRREGDLRTRGTARDIKIIATYAYVAESAIGGTEIIDIDNPSSPILAGQFSSPCDAFGIAVSNDNIYLADSYSFMILQSNITDITDEQEIPSAFHLINNYPNPFNARTVISYSLPKASDITIEVFDILGRKVETLIDGMEKAGNHEVIWNAKGFNSGVYFARLKADGQSRDIKLVLLK